MSNFLRDLAIAHQIHEGFFIGSKSWRHNNPGNIRAPSGEFLVFPTYEAGLAALQSDLRAKITNNSNSMNRYYVRKGITYDQANFLDYIHVYAPTDDGNSPSGYCQDLCRRLAQYNIRPTTPLRTLAMLAEGLIERVPDTIPPSPPLKPEARLRGLVRRSLLSVDEGVRKMAERVAARLRKRIGQ